MTLLTSAAESGHTYAMNQLGWEYHTGEHVTKDDARALRFFTEFDREERTSTAWPILESSTVTALA